MNSRFGNTVAARQESQQEVAVKDDFGQADFSRSLRDNFSLEPELPEVLINNVSLADLQLPGNLGELLTHRQIPMSRIIERVSELGIEMTDQALQDMAVTLLTEDIAGKLDRSFYSWAAKEGLDLDDGWEMAVAQEISSRLIYQNQVSEFKDVLNSGVIDLPLDLAVVSRQTLEDLRALGLASFNLAA